MTTRNELYVEFATDGIHARPSFSINYAACKAQMRKIFVPDVTTAIFTANCTEILTTDTGSISMPTTPAGYTGNQECLWSISVSPLNHVAFMFDSLSVRISTLNQKNL